MGNAALRASKTPPIDANPPPSASNASSDEGGGTTTNRPTTTAAMAGPGAPWRALIEKSLARNRVLPNARYIQVATVRPDGRPSNRTVVFRCVALPSLRRFPWRRRRRRAPAPSGSSRFSSSLSLSLSNLSLPLSHTHTNVPSSPLSTPTITTKNSGFLSASGPAGAAAAAAAPVAAASADALTIVTDARANKVGECALNPRAEVCWYFPKTREQFRVSGTLEIVGPAAAPQAEGEGAQGGDAQAPPAASSSSSRLALLHAAREGAWLRMSEAGREQFFWPHPGQPRLGDDEAAFASESGGARKTARGGGAPAAADAPPPPPPPPVPATFCLGLLEADEVDHVRLTTNRRTRYVLGGGGEWSVEEVNP